MACNQYVLPYEYLTVSVSSVCFKHHQELSTQFLSKILINNCLIKIFLEICQNKDNCRYSVFWRKEPGRFPPPPKENESVFFLHMKLAIITIISPLKMGTFWFRSRVLQKRAKIINYPCFAHTDRGNWKYENLICH